MGTVISTEDILQKVWIPVVEGNQVFADEFLVDHGSQDGDISNNRQQLVIKPKHCQVLDIENFVLVFFLSELFIYMLILGIHRLQVLVRLLLIA